MTDSLLIEKYKSGDQKVLPLLVKRWHIAFCKKAFWVVKDADLAKDIAQDSWMTIIDKLHTLENSDKFKSWAFRIVYTKSINCIKKVNLERIRLNAFTAENTIDTNEKTDNVIVRQKLLNAIKELPIEKQNVIRLFYVEEYSLKEIADILNISIGTVKSRLFQAREKLKTIIKK